MAQITVKILAVATLARKASSLVSQRIQFGRRQLGLVLELAEFAIGAFSFVQMPVIAQVAAGLIHAHLDRFSG